VAKFILHSTRTAHDFRGPATVSTLCFKRVPYSRALLFQGKRDAAVNCVGCRALIEEILGNPLLTKIESKRGGYAEDSNAK
jgi:hypothetical protein